MTKFNYTPSSTAADITSHYVSLLSTSLKVCSTDTNTSKLFHVGVPIRFLHFGERKSRTYQFIATPLFAKQRERDSSVHRRAGAG